MNRQALFGALLSILVAGTPLTATELGLAEAMTMARAQAREVLAAQAKVEAGQSRLEQAKGHRLPQISFQELWITTDNPAEVFALQLNQERFSFDDFVMSDPNQPDTFNNATTRFLLTLPIYTGGELSGRIDQAELASEATTTEAEWVEDGVALAAAEAYIRLAQTRENVELLGQVAATVAAHAALARAYVDQGMLVRSELLRAEVEQSRIQDLLTEARGQARVAEANLSFRLAVDSATRWELATLQDPLPIDTELEHWLASADSRADLQAARQLLDAAGLEIKVQRSGLWPKVGLQARYDFYDDRLFGSNGRSGAVIAMASIDLFSGNRPRAAKAAAEADFAAGQQQISQFTEAIRLEIRDAYERAITARERHRTASAAQAAAIEAERITEERFKQGVVKMIDLLDATTARQEAQTRELVARAEAHLAALALAVKAGLRPEEAISAQHSPQTRSES